MWVFLLRRRAASRFALLTASARSGGDVSAIFRPSQETSCPCRCTPTFGYPIRSLE